MFVYLSIRILKNTKSDLMISLHKAAGLFLGGCFSLISYPVFAQSTNKIKNTVISQTASVLILGSKKDKALQNYPGFNFGLNLSYFKKMPEAEKAILGLIATYAGTECGLEYNTINTEHPRYSCKLTLAMGIGYQCSDEYLAFERKWFRNDTTVLNELKECNIRPSGANFVTNFGRIILTRSPGRVKIYFQKNTFSMRRMTGSEWTETLYFKVDTDQVHLVKRTHTKTITEKYDEPDSL